MHMAHDVQGSFFEIADGEGPITREALLSWEKRDRLGVIVDRPYGGLDAALTIMLAATAFYDADKKRRTRPLYPDMYLFHSGGPWGCHLTMDFAPDRKEVFVAPDAVEMLRAINQVGVTHLLIPERSAAPVLHRFKEPEAAIDRIKQVFVYGPAGEAHDAEIRISSERVRELAPTIEAMLDPWSQLETMQKMRTTPEVRATDKAELAKIIAMMRWRADEVPTSDPDRQRHLERLDTAKKSGRLEERLRRIDTRTALQMLGPSEAA